MAGSIQVDARGRDLKTGKGNPAAEDGQHLTATIGADRVLTEIAAEPAEPRLSQLLGTKVGPGFRGRMVEVLADHADRCTLLHALVDDLPGAALVSGYAVQRARAPEGVEGPIPDPGFVRQVMAGENQCSGWATDATIMVSFREKGAVPMPVGPVAPELEHSGDRLSWHAMEPMAPHATRRRRRLDLLPPARNRPSWAFDSHFRDSYCDDRGVETVIHEYLVDGCLDEACLRIGTVRAEARVLPWLECPAAVGSAGRMAGQPLAGLRHQVRTELVGTTTCTHLNDSLRVLADLATLLALAES